MKKIMIICMGIMVVLFHMGCESQNSPLTELYVESVKEPIINLNGTWKINTTPEKEFWSKNEIGPDWKDIQVPGEIMMQGFSIKHDVPFAYKKEIDIPLDYREKNVHLQFEGVYSYARVWINGEFVKEHHGGFTQWTCDITPYVKAGEKALLTVEVTDRIDEISYASGYAKHQIAGILRDVNLLALPKNYPSEIIVETDLDSDYKDAELSVTGKLIGNVKNPKIEIQLLDAGQKIIKLTSPYTEVDDEGNFIIKNHIINPKKWDAEHPNLYGIRVSYYENDELQYSKFQKVGFREVQVKGNLFLVNGKPVKLRGANRHDVHPTLGRVSRPEYELKDVLLAKEANMNYIRTSHYPPTESFLKLCDEYGIYIEDESAVCFIIHYRIPGYESAVKSQSDPVFTDRYLDQFKEMVNTHRNHPSVVIWSIGNESIYGSNFQKSYDWAKWSDKTRPVKFSYPGTVPDSIAPPYDILSMHYQDINGDLEQGGTVVKGYGNEKMPVVFDEWAHVACYNIETLIGDPNIRDFWGQSLDKMWQGVFDADGGLGGAIWGMIDETFMLPRDLEGFREWWGMLDDKDVLPYQGKTVGYGEWGIVDVWRRKKPEFWNTKKAYSPIRILTTAVEGYKNGNTIELPIYNRFDHTNLKEVRISYTYKDSTLILDSPDLEPHKKGTLTLPITQWSSDEKITIDFHDSNGQLIDSYVITQKSKMVQEVETASSGTVSISDETNVLIVHTEKGNLSFEKATGLLSNMEKEGKNFRVSGPTVSYRTKGKQILYATNAINEYGTNWKLNSITHRVENNMAIVSTRGTYNKIKAEFDIQIFSDGTIVTSYGLENLPKEQLREIGIKYDFDADFDTISWDRKAYWSAYPKDHLGAASGEAELYPKVLNSYREKPNKPWNQDSKSFYYDGTLDEKNDELTLIAKATKENILEYALFANKKKVIVIGDGDVSCRLAKTDNNLELYLINQFDYVDLDWGNYEHNIILKGKYTAKATMKLNPDFGN